MVSVHESINRECRLMGHKVSLRVEQIQPRLSCRSLEIGYSLHDTPLGYLLVASTSRGICYSSFAQDNDAEARQTLQESFPHARLVPDRRQEHQTLCSLLTSPTHSSKPETLALHLRGTNFQIAVWLQLLDVDLGATATYRSIASTLGKPLATRAVASAIGYNPIVPFIPCHRIIRSDGSIGGYSAEGGIERKRTLLMWEQQLIQQSL